MFLGCDGSVCVYFHHFAGNERGSAILQLAGEGKGVVLDLQREVLGDLVLIDHLAHAQTDLVRAAPLLAVEKAMNISPEPLEA